jgi:hypothetical protein
MYANKSQVQIKHRAPTLVFDAIAATQFSTIGINHLGFSITCVHSSARYMRLL